MEFKFALDLKVARRRSGLSQAEVAHLLGVHRTRVSKLELGTYIPSAEELAMLSLIYGKSVTELGSAIMPRLYHALLDRLSTLPNCAEYASGSSLKASTLSALSRDLEASSPASYDE